MNHPQRAAVQQHTFSLKSWVIAVLLLMAGSPFASAQSGAFFPTEPADFITAYGAYLEKSGKEPAITAATSLSTAWNTGAMAPALQDSFIAVANLLASSRISTFPTLTEFTETFLRLDAEVGFARMEPTDYLEYTGKCMRRLSKEETSKFIAVVDLFTETGTPAPKSRYAWAFSDQSPSFGWKEYETLEGKKEMPLLEFGETDLMFNLSNGNDSTHIRATSGSLFPLSMIFRGEGGRVDWAKVELPAEEVYCDLRGYRLNLNYAEIKVDTVAFVYEGLVNQPILGKFEDRNMGHPSPDRAKFPMFQSYEGGVRIESLMPNVIYEGGFTLRGQHKVGTAYWAPAPEEPEEEESSDDEYYDDWTFDTGADDSFDEPDWNSLNGFGADEYADETDDSFSFGLSADDAAFSNMVLTPARLKLYRDGRVFLGLKGNAFSLDTAKLSGTHLETSLYPSETDSIYHPDMQLRYDREDSMVILQHPVGSMRSGIPFVSSYHEYSLYFETLAWDQKQDMLRFLAQLNQGEKSFSIESFDYFNPDAMRGMRGVMRFNPVGAIYRYKSKFKGYPITPDAILEDYNINNDNNYRAFVQTLPRLENEGFLTFDRETKEIFPLPKLTHWGAAAIGRKDYDVITIPGKVVSGPQSVMALSDMEIRMQGVPPFWLSDSLNVAIKPKDNEIMVQENRNLQFGGIVSAGRLLFYSDDPDTLRFGFEYDNYRIYCDSIDSLRFNLSFNADMQNQGAISDLQRALDNTVFEGVTGVVHISAPNNKSGTKGGTKSKSEAEERYYAKYPVFDSYSRSYLYWDDADIEDGVYHRDSMYFAINPFVLDSLENFDPNNLRFTGDFFSSNIFPERPLRNQQLEVMSDYTLGFDYETPPDGLPIYLRKGNFTGTITLDGKGLQGSGKMEFQKTIAESDNFVFYFDSVRAPVKYFSLKRGFKGGFYFPQVQGDSAFYTWYTRDTVLKVSSTYDALTLFDGEGEFEGELSVTPQGMFGRGTLTLGQVQVQSDSLIFREMDFEAKHAAFRIIDEEDSSLVHFLAEETSVAYDVRKHQSTFVSQDLGRKKPSFPSHQYTSSLGQGTYSRDKGTLNIVGVENFERDNFFVSTDPEKLELEFMATKAEYVIDSMRIKVSGVPNILVADAIITPETDVINIEAYGLLDTLRNAEVMAGRDTIIDEKSQRQHRLYEADVQISSSQEYAGEGKYDYNYVENIPQFISFDNIRVSPEGNTVASGEISEEKGFYLTERIFFRGTSELDAQRRFLSFEGEVRIESDNPVFQGEWFGFEKTIVNPDTVIIPIDASILENGDEPLKVGLMYASEDQNFYSRFLQEKEFTYDQEIITAVGGLTFDTKQNAFRIGEEEKLAGRVYRGSTVAFNDSANTVASEGFLKFPGGFAEKTVNVTMSGQWTENLESGEISTDLIMGIDFGNAIPSDVLNKLGGIFPGTFPNNTYVDLRYRPFVNRASELLDGPLEFGQSAGEEKKTRAFVKSVESNPTALKSGLAEELPYSLLLSGVDFQYDENYRALFSDSDIGLLGMAGAPYYQEVSAKVVYEFGGEGLDGDRESDRITVYMELDRNGYSWLYWRFDGEVLYTAGSSTFDESYTKPIETAIKKRKSESGYRVVLAPQEEVDNFKRDFILRFIR